MRYDVSDQERATLNAIQADGEAPEVRRAQIILLSADGLRTTEIAEAVDLSVSQVQHWRRAWRKQRMAIFPAYEADATSPSSAEPPSTSPASVESKPEPEPTPRPGVELPRLALDLHDTIGMVPDDTMAEAGRKALLYHFERMLLNEPGSRAGEDIEAVHDMRVATRRMRSAFNLFDPFYKSDSIKPFVRDLRRVAHALGEVRDLDVSIDKAQRFMNRNPDSDLAPILKGWHKQRTKARRALITELDSERFARFVDKFHAFLTRPGKGAKRLPTSDKVVPYQVRHIAPSLIYAYYEQLRAYDPALNDAPIEVLHALRIDFKRFRYALEFFEEILGSEARNVIEETKIMQDHLGDLNDTQVAGESLRTFVGRHNEKYSGIPVFMRTDMQGVIRYARAQEDEQQHLLTTFPTAWVNFNRDDMRRDLALAVSVL